jgi:DNA repair protein RecN (Recombination protein N)
MIERIQIRGLGVIVDATIPFSSGLTVITGETGAGKTMVLSGFALLAGGKADVGMVRSGSDQAWVDGEWSLASDSSAVQRASDAGADVEVEGGRVRLLLGRTVASEGRSRAFAGGRSVPAGVLQEVSAALVAVHGQSEQMRLRHADTQRNLLDRFGGAPCLEALSNYRAAFAAWRATVERVEYLIDQRESLEREAVLLRIGIAEIDALSPSPGEDVELDRQAARLSHAGELLLDVLAAHDALVGEDGETSNFDIVSVLGKAITALERAVEVDPELNSVLDRLAQIGSLASDAAVELATYATDIEADPARQAWVEQRRHELGTLRRRYGATIDEVIAWHAAASASVSEVDLGDDRMHQLTELEAAQREELVDRARHLSGLRSEASLALAQQVTAELHALAMPDASLEVRVTSREGLAELSAHGADEVELLLRPHTGAEYRPLSKGASGGELSRVMLALEVVLAGADPVPTFIFDEVDAGIGGRAAVEVGRRLARLSRTAQVIVVTHLPQVAAFADQHVVVSKGADGVVTSSSVVVASGRDRVSELVRMLSGLDASEAGAAHAEELLAVAEQERASGRS